MACERIHRSQLLLAALAAIAIALVLPAAGQAADSGRLASAGVLARGSGYETAGSDAVRVLQRRLRRMGTPPGPIDGYFGPLTEGAVKRFQQRHGLAVDGVVGRQTKRQLFISGAQRLAAPVHHDTQPGTQPGGLTRKSPTPHRGVESADQPQQARPAGIGVASRDGPEDAPAVPPELVAAVVGLGALLLGALWWQRRHQLEAGVNVGLACAALLGMFGIGAAAGAVFATKAAPDGAGDANAESGVLLASADSSVRADSTSQSPKSTTQRKQITRTRTARAATARRPDAAPAALIAASPATVLAASKAAPAPRPAPAPVPAKRPKRSTYVVQPGDSLSGIAKSKLGASSSAANVVKGVEKLTDLNIATRIRSGDPDSIEAGERLRLP
jgi:LysM repeat protein